MSTNGHDESEDTEVAMESPAELRTQIEILAEENDRLRTSYTQAKQTQYRRTAAGLAALGILAVIGGIFFETAQTVLFALGSTGLFGAVLTYYLTPEQFVSADVGRAVFSSLAANEAALSSELGLIEDQVYIPTGETTTAVRLFIPQMPLDRLPEAADLEQTLVTTESGIKGLALTPSGRQLFREFAEARTGSATDEPAALATQLTEALIEQFELVQTAEPELDVETNRLTVSVSGSAYGDLDTFDHPVSSFLAVGFATELDRPVASTIQQASEDGEQLVTLRWTAPEAAANQPPEPLS